MDVLVVPMSVTEVVGDSEIDARPTLSTLAVDPIWCDYMFLDCALSRGFKSRYADVSPL